MKFKSIYELDNSFLRRKFLEKSIRIKNRVSNYRDGTTQRKGGDPDQ